MKGYKEIENNKEKDHKEDGGAFFANRGKEGKLNYRTTKVQMSLTVSMSERIQLKIPSRHECQIKKQKTIIMQPTPHR